MSDPHPVGGPPQPEGRWARSTQVVAQNLSRAGRVTTLVSLAVLVIPAVLIVLVLVIGLWRGGNVAVFALVASAFVAFILLGYGLARRRTLYALSHPQQLAADLKSLATVGDDGEAVLAALNEAATSKRIGIFRRLKTAWTTIRVHSATLERLRSTSTLRNLAPPRINATATWTVLAIAMTPVSVLLLITVVTMAVISD